MISEICKAALLHGAILMNGDVPAGHDLMTSSVMKIALIENQPVTDILSPELQDYLAKEDILGRPTSFPAEMQEHVKKGIDFWYKGDVEFVSPHDNPDLFIIAHDHESGASFGSYPINDHPDQDYNQGFSQQIIAINTDSINIFQQKSPELGSGQIIENLIRHEFGHTMGIDHPLMVIKDLVNEGMTCTAEEYAAMRLEARHGGIMSPLSLTGKEDDIDISIREKIAIPPPSL